MEIKLDEIVRMTGGQLRGDGNILIKGVAGIEEAQEGEITFLSNPRYRRFLESSKASAIIISEEMTEAAHIPAIVARNPYYCFLKVLEVFHKEKPNFPKGVHETAVISQDAELGHDVSAGPHVFIDDGTKIGDGAVICANVALGRNCRIGRGTVIYPNVTIYEGTEIGENVIIHAGAVIGSDGFGFALEGGEYHKIPQVGIVVVEDGVEIGANTTIDRGTMGATRIKRGAKIDNLVQIAHNVVVGENTAIAAQVGIAGSTHIGKGVQIGGQAGFVDHIKIGDGARVGAQAGVTKSFPEKAVVTGYPARALNLVKRIEASETRLPELLKIVREQQRRIEELEKKLSQNNASD